MQARLVVEDIMLKAVRGWARSLGLVSYEKTKIRSDGAAFPQVGTLAWDLSVSSYLGGLVDRSADGVPSPGFLVCDVVLGPEVSGAGLAPFVLKCKTLRSLRKVGRCLQLFIADRYSKDAFKLAKSAGIMPATPATLFGEEVAASLRKLSEVLQPAAAIHDPTVFDTLFKGLSRIEGAATNLRGALFEFWAAQVVEKKYGGPVWLNRVYADGDKTAEVDVVRAGSDQVRFYECKGYQPHALVPDEEIERWLDTRVPSSTNAPASIRTGSHATCTLSSGRLADSPRHRLRCSPSRSQGSGRRATPSHIVDQMKSWRSSRRLKTGP